MSTAPEVFALTPPKVRTLSEGAAHQRIIEATATGEWFALHEIVNRVWSLSGKHYAQTAVSARVRELRRLGHRVETRCSVSSDGVHHYTYRITRGGP